MTLPISNTLKPSEPQRRRRTRRRQLIGAIDQGTSSTRFLVFENGTGRLMASSQVEIKRIVPKEGWVEIDPLAIMDSVYSTIANVHEQLTASYGDSLSQLLKCIGICNQRESAVVWDSQTGLPLYNVIVWMDNRTKDIVDKMIDSAPGRDFNWLKDKTGLPMSTYFSAFKLKWLIDNVHEVKMALKEKRLLFGTVDSWILWNLTGQHLTDVSNASRTFLMDIETLEWDKSLCKHFGVPAAILPKILASADHFGQVLHGPLKGLPITGVIGDQSAALFGHNCLQLGQTKATFGTGCFVMQNIGPGPLHGALKGTAREAKRGLITTVGFKLRDKPACYALEGSIKIAGAALTWLRDNMQLIENYEECDHLVNMTNNSAGVFFVPALGGLYSPYWDPNAAGLYIGLSQFSRREHLIRSTFDSIAFQTNDILSLMRGVTHGLMIDGGLCKSDNMCQILADITGCDIVRPSMCETSALGAAMVAGCGAGIWSYESMLANSNKPYQCNSNQNHHYPHESLHYEDKFSSLIQSKAMERRSSVADQPADGHNLSAQTTTNHLNDAPGIGINDDAGGGGVNDDAGGGRRSGPGQAAPTAQGELTPDGVAEEADDAHQFESSLERVAVTGGYYAPLSSGYSSSGDNFNEASSTAPSCSDPNRRDSPICPRESPSLPLISAEQMLMAAECSSSASTPPAPCDDLQIPGRESPGSAATVKSVELQQQVPTAVEVAQESDNTVSSFPERLKACLRSYLSSPQSQLVAIDHHHHHHHLHNLHHHHHHHHHLNNQAGEFEDDDLFTDDDGDAYDELSANSSDQERSASADNVGKLAKVSTMLKYKRPVDVFQSYISLEHRTELVNTWRRAVERSMQWTKVHHEEVRKIDYQRLSSLPISMYLFFSIGMVCLSGILTSTGR